MRNNRLMFGVATLCLASWLTGCGGGSDDGGPSLSTKVQQAMNEPNPATRVQRLVVVAKDQHQAGDKLGAGKSLANALLAAAQIEQSDIQADAYTQIALTQARLDRPTEAKDSAKKAEQALQEVSDPEIKVPVLLTLASIYTEYLDSSATAEYYLETAREAGGEIERPQGKLETKLKVAQAYAALGNSESAAAIFQEAVGTIGEVPDARKRADLQILAFASASKLGSDDQAAELRAAAETSISQIETPLSQGHAWLNFAQTLKSLGDPETSAAFKQAETAAEKVGDRALQTSLQEEIQAAR